jgi:hypothetical protein
MSNNDGVMIPILHDDMGEGFKELWKDYEETMKVFENKFKVPESVLKVEKPKED